MTAMLAAHALVAMYLGAQPLEVESMPDDQPVTYEPVTYGPYSLVMNLIGGRMSILRRDDDGHTRTVAFVDSLGDWCRFVAALQSGANEVAAVHAIDVW